MAPSGNPVNGVRYLLLMVRLARLPFITAGFLLFCLGVLFAHFMGAALDLPRIILGYLIFGFIHLSVSFSNDYFDRETDRYGTQTLISGGSGVLVRHPGLSSSALYIALALISGALILTGMYVISFGLSWQVMLFVITGILLGWYYSSPPLKLAYRGLGEPATAVALGVLTPGMGYLIAAGNLDGVFLLLSIPFIFYGIFFILCVEMPDREADLRGGKRTYIVRHGRRAGWGLITLSALAGSLWFGVQAFSGIGLDRALSVPLFCLSLPVIAAAAVGLHGGCSDRSCAYRSAFVALGTLIFFVASADLIFLLLLSSAP